MHPPKQKSWRRQIWTNGTQRSGKSIWNPTTSWLFSGLPITKLLRLQELKFQCHYLARNKIPHFETSLDLTLTTTFGMFEFHFFLWPPYPCHAVGFPHCPMVSSKLLLIGTLRFMEKVCFMMVYALWCFCVCILMPHWLLLLKFVPLVSVCSNGLDHPISASSRLSRLAHLWTWRAWWFTINFERSGSKLEPTTKMFDEVTTSPCRGPTCGEFDGEKVGLMGFCVPSQSLT